MKILTIVGARPQFVKAAMVSRAIVNHNLNGDGPHIIEEIIHTGQHYDPEMSDIFFEQMGIPEPAVNLEVGSGNHGAMTAKMLEGIEREILDRKPDWLLVYGDTNSTLAGALAASKLHVPVAHVEAGLRSFNKKMPEEINRILTDHVSKLLLCPTDSAVKNLKNEGLTDGVIHMGDVMYDAAMVFAEIAKERSTILSDLSLDEGNYYLVTVHRAENTDSKERLTGIFEGLAEVAQDAPVVYPVHPRTKKYIEQYGLEETCSALKMIQPVSFLDMVRLEVSAKTIITDSGGVQKEAYFHDVPCVTMRDETEWVETVEAGWNQVVGADKDQIVQAAKAASKGSKISQYGDGTAAEKVVGCLLKG